MRFGAITWNMCVWTEKRNHLKFALLDRLDWHIATLQEVSPSTLAALRERVDGDVVGASGFDADPDSGADVVDYGCAIATRQGATIIDSGLVPIDDSEDGPWIEGSTPHHGTLVWARVRLPDDTELDVVSAHPAHAYGKGDDRRRRVERKLRAYAALERWMAHRDLSIVGMDANAWIDGARRDQLFNSTFTETDRDRGDEQRGINLFFQDSVNRHGHHDAYRLWLEADPSRLTAVRQHRPEGPLAVTFVRGSHRKVADRFDAILATPSIRVLNVAHAYDDSVAAGSDHSYVHATVEV